MAFSKADKEYLDLLFDSKLEPLKQTVKTHDTEIQKLRSFKNIFLPIVGLAQAISIGIGMWLEEQIKK